MQEKKEKPRQGIVAKIFQQPIDFYAMLEKQAQTTVLGIQALQEWLTSGAGERCQTVRDFEHEADEQKLELGRQLVESFITPFDREDIYDLSARLDEVINSAKTTVREIEALNYCPRDNDLLEMATILVEGTQALAQAFSNLDKDLVQANVEATFARKSENRFEKVYRKAMRELFTMDDMKTILRTMEVYRCMVHTAQHIDVVGEKLLHVIVKIS